MGSIQLAIQVSGVPSVVVGARKISGNYLFIEIRPCSTIRHRFLFRAPRRNFPNQPSVLVVDFWSVMKSQHFWRFSDFFKIRLLFFGRGKPNFDPTIVF